MHGFYLPMIHITESDIRTYLHMLYVPKLKLLNFYAQNPPNSISECLIFQIFLGGMPPDPPSISMLCMLIVLRTIYTTAINQDPPLAKFWIRPWI